MLQAKVKNQEVVLQRYKRGREVNLSEELKMMRISIQKMEGCQQIDQLMGYEGTAARYYFQGLAKVTEPEFYFQGRSKRPPKDEFNSMLSLGYSILLNEIYGKLQNKGLNPYFGFVHQDREKHPTLASDLMEEWRAVIVDSVVMSLVNGHEITKSHFRQNADMPGYYLTNEGMKIFIQKLEKKIHTDTRYLDYIDYPVSFRRAMELQIMQLVRAIEAEDVTLYQPIRIR